MTENYREHTDINLNIGC